MNMNKKGTVLLVEDNPELCANNARALAMLGPGLVFQGRGRWRG